MTEPIDSEKLIKKYECCHSMHSPYSCEKSCEFFSGCSGVCSGEDLIEHIRKQQARIEELEKENALLSDLSVEEHEKVVQRDNMLDDKDERITELDKESAQFREALVIAHDKLVKASKRIGELNNLIKNMLLQIEILDIDPAIYIGWEKETKKILGE